jgi:hypothetical protein
MTTVSIPLEGYIFQDTDDKSFRYMTYESSADYLIKVGTIDTSICYHLPPEYHPIGSHIAKLEDQLSKAAEAYYGLKVELEGKIADLKCISYQDGAIQDSYEQTDAYGRKEQL